MGKDKFADLMIEFFDSKKILSKKFALANQLKEHLSPLVKDAFGWDIFKLDPCQKEIIRPIMVAYGCAQRKRSMGKYWCGYVDIDIDNDPALIAIISDIRFDEYPEDEVWWIKEKHKGKLIHLSRINTEGVSIGPANREEYDNELKLIASADYRLTWDTDESKCRDFVFNFMEEHPELWKL